MTEHTAGPWEWNDKDQLVAVNVLGEPYFDDEDGTPVVIIETDSGFYPPRGADRKLLAAAPDLLTALLLVQGRLITKCEQNLVTFNDDDVDALAAAFQAIDKATGGAS